MKATEIPFVATVKRGHHGVRVESFAMTSTMPAEMARAYAQALIRHADDCDRKMGVRRR